MLADLLIWINLFIALKWIVPVIAEYTAGNYREEETIIDQKDVSVKRIIFSFET